MYWAEAVDLHNLVLPLFRLQRKNALRGFQIEQLNKRFVKRSLTPQANSRISRFPVEMVIFELIEIGSICFFRIENLKTVTDYMQIADLIHAFQTGIETEEEQLFKKREQ